jgi:endonuclease YncB( thermonuclease family)
MAKFPVDRVYRRTGIGFGRRVLIALLLLAMCWAAWLYAAWTDQRQPVPIDGQKIYVVDGDSFAIGNRKLRLDGIDAPELRQTCVDAKGTEWPCGRVSRAALESLLLAPGLSCVAEASDQYARALAQCTSSSVPDIAAAQVIAGMAVSHEFHGMRDYGGEEDTARNANKGIWQGTFQRPITWRADHPRTGPVR